MSTAYSFGSNSTATLCALPTAPPLGSIPTISPLPGSTYTTLNWNSVSVISLPQCPACGAVHATDVEVNVRLAQSGRVGRGDIPARAAVMVGLVDEHLLHVGRVRAATNWMGRTGPAAVRAVQHDVEVIRTAVDVGGPADLGGGDGATVACFVIHNFNGTIRVEGDRPYRHALPLVEISGKIVMCGTAPDVVNGNVRSMESFAGVA